MQTKRDSIRTTIRLLLLGILLTAQALSFAHEAMHLSGDETELCEICRIQDNTPAITSLVQPQPPTIHAGRCPQSIHTSVHGSGPLASFQPRAPPHFL